MAGLSEIPAYIREANDQQMLEMALVENVQRADLNAIETAISYQRLIDECKLTHEEMSQRIGKNRSTVTNYLRLLKLPPAIQQAIKLNRISMGHARTLLSLELADAQLHALKEVLEKDLSVRATEDLCRSLTKTQGRPLHRSDQELPAAYRQTVDHLTRKLGTRVEMKRKTTGTGHLVIHFQDDEQLNELLDLLDASA